METSAHAVINAAAIMMVTIFAARLLGVVRESVTVYKFGSDSMEMAAIEAALTIPNLIFYLVAGGALRSGFVPVFTGYLVKGRSKDAWAVFSGFVTFLVVVGGGLLALAALFAVPLVKLAAPGFGSTASALAVQLTRIMLPVQLFLLLGGLFGGVLNSLGHFWMPALAPIVYNSAIIASVLWLTPHAGAASFPLGMLAGAFCGHLVLQLPALKRLKVRFWPNFHWSHEGIVTVFKLALPIIVGMTAVEINGRVNIALASTLSNEAVVALGRAFRVARLPDGIFAMGVGIAMLPALSHIGAREEMEAFRSTLARALKAIIVATVPSAALLIVLREPIMALIYQHGLKVRPEDVRLMAAILLFYSLGIVPLSLRVVLTRSFYALKDTWTPAYIGLVEVATCVGLNLLMVKSFGAVGLALGTAIASSLAMSLMFVAFYKRVGPLGARRLFDTLARTLLAAAAMALVAWLCYTPLAASLGKGMLPTAVAFLTAASLAGLVYFGLCKLLKVEEVDLVVAKLRQRFLPAARSK